MRRSSRPRKNSSPRRPTCPWVGPTPRRRLDGAMRSSRPRGAYLRSAPMDPLPRAAVALLSRHPSPALSMEDLQELLKWEDPFASPGDDEVLRRLDLHGRGLRVLVRPKRRWMGPVGPAAWILAETSDREARIRARPALGLLRSSVLSLGALVEPGSGRRWARWTRLLREEARLRTSLERPLRSRDGAPANGPERRPSTTPPPDPPRPGRARAHRPPPRAHPPRGGGHPRGGPNRRA